MERINKRKPTANRLFAFYTLQKYNLIFKAMSTILTNKEKADILVKHQEGVRCVDADSMGIDELNASAQDTIAFIESWEEPNTEYIQRIKWNIQAINSDYLTIRKGVRGYDQILESKNSLLQTFNHMIEVLSR